MALSNLKQNINEEREIINEILVFSLQYSGGEAEREMLSRTMGALLEMLKIINDSIPSLIDGISALKHLDGKESRNLDNMVNFSYQQSGIGKSVTIRKEDRKKFLEDLRLLDSSVGKIRKEEKEKEIVFKQFKKPSKYARISNKFFSGVSNNLVKKGYFDNVSADLRKSNMPFIINTYVSIMLFSALIAAAVSVLLFILLFFFSVSINFPFLIAAQITFSRIMYNLLFCIALPVITFFTLYFYPYTERQSIGKRIEQELPFVVIHMSAIAGSGIEPTQIFKIIALGKEYPYMKQELRKIMNQVNFFGYDFISALRSSARTAPSRKLGDVFNGLATTIASGGSLTDFLDKRAETLLFDYKLEREKSAKMAESFMDIYISVVIAAPMIMMLLMILMSTGMVSIGLSLAAITILIISAVALINVIFLVFLHLKQPTY